MSFYVWETRKEQETTARTCEYCSNGFDVGYLHEDSSMTFCTFHCCIKVLGMRDAIKLRDSKELFWTEWEESD